MVDTVFNNAIDSLSDDDKKLPQVWHFRYCFQFLFNQPVFTDLFWIKPRLSKVF